MAWIFLQFDTVWFSKMCSARVRVTHLITFLWDFKTWRCPQHWWSIRSEFSVWCVRGTYGPFHIFTPNWDLPQLRGGRFELWQINCNHSLPTTILIVLWAHNSTPEILETSWNWELVSSQILFTREETGASDGEMISKSWENEGEISIRWEDSGLWGQYEFPLHTAAPH